MKRPTLLISLACLAACLHLYSCHDTQTKIQGCCDEPPVNEKVGVGRVWVPNVFTPNGDGLHDRMLVYGDSMTEIVKLEIRNKENVIVYYNLHIPFNNYSYGWDGSNLSGRIERGLYCYTMEVRAVDNTIKTITGHICNCPCDQMGDEDFKPISNCEFGICPPNLDDCNMYEPLPCFQH